MGEHFQFATFNLCGQLFPETSLCSFGVPGCICLLLQGFYCLATVTAAFAERVEHASGRRSCASMQRMAIPDNRREREKGFGSHG